MPHLDSRDNWRKEMFLAIINNIQYVRSFDIIDIIDRLFIDYNLTLITMLAM